MSQLSQLIEQARKTRRLQDIFNIQPTSCQPEADNPGGESLLVSLAALESNLFAQSPHKLHAVNDLVNELEAIASGL